MTPPPPTLIAQRCHHHVEREAVARCPGCGMFFCRECVTEHDDRMICASCLRKITGGATVHRHRFSQVAGALMVSLAGILVAWIFFYSMGRLLLLTPTSFHEGTLWHQTGGDP